MIKLWKFILLILFASTYLAQPIEKLIYADAGCNELVAIWNYESIDGVWPANIFNNLLLNF
jgi:hypothetical protein